MNKITLYRLVGLKELQLIEQSEMKEFPPRLDWQPIFYPVLKNSMLLKLPKGGTQRMRAQDLLVL